MQDTKRKIMQAALELYLSDSYHRVSIDQIAELAGVSKGGVFHHFESKYQLARETVMDAFAGTWSQGFEALELVEDPVERIRRMIRMSIEMGAASGQLTKVIFEVLQEGIRLGDSGADIADALGSFEQPVARWLDECGVPGSETKAVLLVAALDGLLAQVAMFDEEDRSFDADTIEAELLELFVGNYT